MTDRQRMSEPKPLDLAEQKVIVAAADKWRSAPFDEHIGELFDVVARMVAAAEQTARAEERERIAGEIAGSYPLNGELRHDGSADPLAAAYVEGLHDAWAIVRSTP